METLSQTDKQLYSDIFHAIDFEKIIDHPNFQLYEI